MFQNNVWRCWPTTNQTRSQHHKSSTNLIHHRTFNEITKKDLDTLFIVAGCAGAGKLTIIRTSHLLNLPLFGNDFHQKFRETCTSPNFDEYKGYTDAKKYGSIFQARHLTRLEQDPSPPDTLLLHIDLKGVAKRLGYEAATKSGRERIKKRTTTPTPPSQMIAPDICDLMVSSYLKNPFF